METAKRYEKLRGWICGYGQRMRKNGSLTRSEAAVLARCAKEILGLGGADLYRYAQQLLIKNNELLA